MEAIEPPMEGSGKLKSQFCREVSSGILSCISVVQGGLNGVNRNSIASCSLISNSSFGI